MGHTFMVDNCLSKRIQFIYIDFISEACSLCLKAQVNVDFPFSRMNESCRHFKFQIFDSYFISFS